MRYQIQRVGSALQEMNGSYDSFFGIVSVQDYFGQEFV